VFRKSRKSSTNGACVQVDLDTPGEVKVRDSKDERGPVLSFTDAEWDAFVDGVRGGEFDRAVSHS
jgi:uncharacterized protein DUF397